MIATLEEHLIETNEPDDFDTTNWRITDIQSANWAAMKVRKARAAKAAAKAEFEGFVDAARYWLDECSKEYDRDIAFFEGHLQAWLEREIAADDSKRPKQSRSLPCGVTVKRTAGRERVDVFAEDDFIQWAIDTGRTDLIKTKHTPSKVDIAGLTQHDGQFVTEDGEIVPGVTVVRGEDRYSVDVGGNDE